MYVVASFSTLINGSYFLMPNGFQNVFIEEMVCTHPQNFKTTI